MNYNETLEYLYSRLPVFHFVGSNAYKPGLDNTIALMDALNHPYRNYRTIHVAGTNGKGSVSHFLSAILQSAGYKVGLYTSPHLVDFAERIKINGKCIDKQYVVDFVEDNSNIFDNIQPSFFEATMAMAFRYFSDKKVDIAIIEVGLGGRLDSTNIITPDLSVITNISFDHVAFLGDSISKIAAEKAGIIKNTVPVVIGERHPESENVFIQHAETHKSNIYFADNEINIVLKAVENFKMMIAVDNRHDYIVGLSGKYQLKNVATVIEAVKILNMLDYKIDNKAISAGLEQVVELTGFMGRWQLIRKNPVTIVDTAHNLAGVTELVEHLNSLNYSQKHLVFGMVNDKDITEVLKVLPNNGHYYFTQANIPRALPANELKIQAVKHGLQGNEFETVGNAIKSAFETANRDDLILVFGSNFVVGEAITAIKKLFEN